MSTPEHREVAELFLQKARADFSAAQVLNANENQADHVIGFHLQQAVEKALKAILAGRQIEIPRTHDLGYLLERLGPGDGMPPAVAASDWLTPWGVLFRYDDDSLAALDRDRALEAGAQAIAWAEEAVG